jgi:predicted nuclease with TOPRIM domain
MTEPEWNCSAENEDKVMLGLLDKPQLESLIANTKKIKKDYDSLQERFQKLWFENHSIKELNIQLQDRIEELEGILKYEQDFK